MILLSMILPRQRDERPASRVECSGCAAASGSQLSALSSQLSSFRLPPSAFSFPVSGLPLSLPLMSPSGLPAEGYPASARWHVFRFLLPSTRYRPLATRYSCAAASAAFAQYQFLMSDPYSYSMIFLFSTRQSNDSAIIKSQKF